MKKEERSFLIGVITWMLFSTLWILGAINLLKNMYANIIINPNYNAPIFILIWFCVSGAYLLYSIFKIGEKIFKITEKSANQKQNKEVDKNVSRRT